MNSPIWPIITENLAEQLSATQAGIVHSAQLLPYLPLSLQLIEQTLDALAESDRVQKETISGLIAYVFKESINKPQHKFAPRNCIYSNEPLDDFEYAVITRETREKIETELSHLAANDVWPSEAVWEHELIYLVQNLNDPTSTSEIAGHSRLPFKRVELRLNELKSRRMLRCNDALNAWECPPMRYPKPAYVRNADYIRRFPGAIREEVEIRLIRALSISLVILLLAFILAITAKFPFPFVFFGGLIASVLIFFKVFKTPPKAIPDF